MDIVSTTESSALKLEYNKKISEAQNLRKDILRILKMAKPEKDNLTRRKRTAIKEIREDDKYVFISMIKEQDLFELKKVMP